MSFKGKHKTLLGPVEIAGLAELIQRGQAMPQLAFEGMLNL